MGGEEVWVWGDLGWGPSDSGAELDQEGGSGWCDGGDDEGDVSSSLCVHWASNHRLGWAA